MVSLKSEVVGNPKIRIGIEIEIKDILMKNNTIFIGGIHGVGKTTLCKKLSTQTGLIYYSASNLIKNAKAHYNNYQDKRVLNVDNNQKLLIKAISEYVAQTNYHFLDGHFCLLNSKYEVIRVQKNIFRVIKLAGIITLQDSISNIHKKIYNRDCLSYDRNLLRLFQDEELSYSKSVAKEFQIPYMLFDVNDKVSKIVEFTNYLIGRNRNENTA